MELPVQITFRNFSPSHAVEARIRKRALKLDHVFDRITACRVVAEVRFAEEPGEKGAQASTVARVGRGGKHLM